ncbi:MAG: PAS domain S-box protein [Desulfosarcinaceae bacterium]
MKPSYKELLRRVRALASENVRPAGRYRQPPGHPDLLQLVVEYTPAAIAILDHRLRYLCFSRRYLHDYRLRADDIIGRNHHEVFPDLPKRWKREHLRCLKGERFGPLVDLLDRADGRREWVKRQLAPWYGPDRSVGGIIIFNEIITREREAIAALQESERQYRELVESINDVIYAIRPNGRVIYISPSIQSMVGYTADEIVGHHFLSFVDPRDRERLADAFRRKADAGVTTSEYRLRSKEGHPCWVRASAQPIYEEGLLRELRGVVTDIEREKQAQAERRELEAQLQRAQKMEALGTLAGGVAHDLNNLLSGIVAYPDLLLMDLPEGSPLRQPITTMKQTGQRAAAVVQDLLALARRGVMIKEAINLNTVIRQCLQSPEWLKVSAEYPGVRVETIYEADLLYVEGSPVHLHKAIFNLMCNALEAIETDGVIQITSRNRHLERALLSAKDKAAVDYVEVEIRDNGRGISEADRDHIFEPFYTRKQMGRSGTGLGMAVVWGTVTDHEGTVDVASQEGQGTTVTVTLPATPAARLAVVEEVGDVYCGQGQSLLVVDDRKEQRFIATQILDRLGYRASAAESGEAALAYLADNAADLVLLDMIMAPGIDGLETLRRIRARDPEQAVILVSGYAQNDRIQAALGLGAAFCLRKPYTAARLGRAVYDHFARNGPVAKASGGH